MELKVCSVCKIEKPLPEFDYRYKSKEERQGRCKECRRRIDQKRKKVTLISDYEGSCDVNDAIDILETLGYDTKGNVHEQFKERIFTKYGVRLQ